ncbi:MAG: hypothetical protein KGL39_36480 [Patescibacteria group bacterium]|nr:hypothetical protein [Patescibacteria group bacterium]
MTINYADGKGTLLKQVPSGRKSDPDMYGPMEDRGWDPDGSSAKMVNRPGINRKQQMLDVMDQVANSAPVGNTRPNAQVPNIRVQGGRMANYGDE